MCMNIDIGSDFERRLRREISGEVMFDVFNRGRYATDASFYQMMPHGVVVPRTIEDVEACISVAKEYGTPLLARGGGTSQCGQTVNHALVMDNSKHLNRVLELDVENFRCVVEPGIVLDELNRILKPHGLWFPVDVSTASRATIGGMCANNSCGGRSIRYGIMRNNVLSIDAILADGQKMHFGEVNRNNLPSDLVRPQLVQDMLALGAKNADEIEARFPKVLRRVGGYNIDALTPSDGLNSLSDLLVGSEGTLAYSSAIELKLAPLVKNKVLGVCHFPTFHAAMDATQHLAKLGVYGVELVDATMIALARDIEIFRPTIEQVVRGNPEAILLVEYGEDEPDSNLQKLKELKDVMGDIGFSWKGEGKAWGGVVSVIDSSLQTALVEVRKAGLNIMMSMKEQGKPVSFVEDCAVELPDLADYTDGLTEIFAKNGTKGTWYAHASVGCLHVRPVLNLRMENDVKTMRAIADEAFELVAKYKGSHSGEHGDGIVRSEFHERMFGKQLTSAFEQIKEAFDPDGLFNPGKIVHAPKMDDRSLFRYNHHYKVDEIDTALDWSQWPGAGGGFQGAVEMCNNNGACRKLTGGLMCPSYRVTRNERDATRGRANTLRLAISGQLGKDAFSSDEMMEAMELCVSCKGCRRECPTGVDMARMKIEVLRARTKKYGLSLHNRLVGYMPAYAPFVSKVPWLMNLRDGIPGIAKLLDGLTGFSAKRKLPKWHSKPFKDDEVANSADDDNTDVETVALFVDPFNRYFEPENLRAAIIVLSAAGIAVEVVKPVDGGRPLHSGRTYLSVGLTEKAKYEAGRLVESLLKYAKAGTKIIGLEPSSLLTLRDEIPALLPGPDTDIIAKHAMMFEEYIAQKIAADEFNVKLKSPAKKLLLHGHCHQKSFGIMSDIEKTLDLLPDTQLEIIDSGCCGMAGSFGYGVKTYETSMKMGELALFPAIRKDKDALVVADGTSCRHQIADGTGRKALHVARILEMALDGV